MSIELHIDSSALYGDPGGNPSEFSGASLLTRIWLWLSQMWGRESFAEAAESVFCLGPNDTLNGHRFQNLVPANRLNRQRRRMLARYIRAGLSLEQIKAWVKARRKAYRFQTRLAGHNSLTSFRRAARRLSHLWLHDLGQSELCKAPLTPD